MAGNALTQKLRRMSPTSPSEREVILMSSVLELQHRVRALEARLEEVEAEAETSQRSINVGYEVLKAAVARLLAEGGVFEESAILSVFEQEEARVLDDDEAGAEDAPDPAEPDPDPEALWEVMPPADPDEQVEDPDAALPEEPH
jgi:hypothetical protein